MKGWVGLGGWLRKWDSLPARRQSPIPVLTGLDVEQLRWSRPTRYRYTKPPTVLSTQLLFYSFTCFYMCLHNNLYLALTGVLYTDTDSRNCITAIIIVSMDRHWTESSAVNKNHSRDSRMNGRRWSRHEHTAVRSARHWSVWWSWHCDRAPGCTALWRTVTWSVLSSNQHANVITSVQWRLSRNDKQRISELLCALVYICISYSKDVAQVPSRADVHG